MELESFVRLIRVSYNIFFFLKSELIFRNLEQLYSIRCFYHKEIQQWCFFFFIPSKLVEGIKRGESAFEFPMIFQLSFCLPAADRNPFLARDPQEKQRTLWSGVLRSIVADIRPFLLLLFLLRFLAQFLFSCLPPIRSTPERSSFCYSHGPLLVFLRIIYLLLQFFHVRIVVCCDPLEN